MFLLYLDASGTPDLKDVNTKHYVLVGLCMRESTWFSLDKRIQVLKNRYCFPEEDPERFEIHVKQFAVSYQEQDDIAGFEGLSWTDRRSQVRALRDGKLKAEKDSKKHEERRKRYRETDPYVHLARRERSQLLEDTIDVIAGHEHIRLFGEGVYKAHPSVGTGHCEPLPQAFTQVVARFDTFLRKKDTWKLQKSHRRSIDYGLLMLDQDPSTESMIAKLFRAFRERGHSFGAVTPLSTCLFLLQAPG